MGGKKKKGGMKKQAPTKKKKMVLDDDDSDEGGRGVLFDDDDSDRDRSDDSPEKSRRLECYQTPESATWAYRCGVFFDIVNTSATTINVRKILAGAKGGERTAVLYSCQGGSAGKEMDKQRWRDVWRGTLLENKSTPMDVNVFVGPKQRIGFLLHSDVYALWHSESNHGASDGYLRIEPGLRSSEKRQCSPFQTGYLSDDKATFAGAVEYVFHQVDVNLIAEVTKDGTWPLMRSKLSVVGEGRAGKTSTIKRLLGLPFDPSESSTVGAATSACEIHRTETDDFRQVTKDAKHDYLAHRNAAIHRAAASQQEDQPVVPPVRDHDDNSEKAEAPTTETEEPTFDKEKALTVYQEAVVKEASEAAKKLDDFEIDKLKLSVWDYGGQRVFYDLHHLFLTRQAFYLVVFSMDKFFRDETSEHEVMGFLLFWLRSLKMHAPSAPIALVGTHKDVVDAEESHRFIHEKIVCALADNTKKRHFLLSPVIYNEDLCFFPVDNATNVDPTLRGLKDAIRKAVLKEDYVSEETPIKWLKLVSALESVKKPWLTLSEVAELAASEAGILEEETLEKALTKFYEIGLLLWWDTPELRSRVILDPQYLVNDISKIIRNFQCRNQV